MAMASNVGQISILEPHDTISTGFSEGVFTEIGWNPVLGKIELIKLNKSKIIKFIKATKRKNCAIQDLVFGEICMAEVA